MRYKWGISHAPHVHHYMDLVGFIPLHSRPKCGQLIVKPMSKAGNGSFVIATFGFRNGGKDFVWLSYRKQDHASIEICRHFLIGQMGFRYNSWSHLSTFSFSPVAGRSLCRAMSRQSGIWHSVWAPSPRLMIIIAYRLSKEEQRWFLSAFLNSHLPLLVITNSSGWLLWKQSHQRRWFWHCPSAALSEFAHRGSLQLFFSTLTVFPDRSLLSRCSHTVNTARSRPTYGIT